MIVRCLSLYDIYHLLLMRGVVFIVVQKKGKKMDIFIPIYAL